MVDLEGLDSKFSISKNSMLQLVNECHEAFKSIGIVKFGPSSNEIPYLKFRRSIYASASIRKGEVLSKENTKVVRPSYGLHPKFFTNILGKKAKKNIKFAERISKKKITTTNNNNNWNNYNNTKNIIIIIIIIRRINFFSINQ